MTWNAEGLKSSIFMVKDTLDQHKPSFGFISESQVFQADIASLMKYLQSDYCYFLNSEDYHNPESAMTKNTTVGGTLLLWRKDLDPYVSVYPVQSTSFLPIILQMPGLPISVHIALYLPTHGKDGEFVSELASLRICIDEISLHHPDCLIFIRGDCNTNKKNLRRVSLLQQLQRDFSLKRVHIPHNTYHHFVGNGSFDSDIDVILHTDESYVEEKVDKIICKHDNPLLLSHHDIILSSVSLPLHTVTEEGTELVTAPKLPNERVKITWSDEGVKRYQISVAPQLRLMREAWLDSASPASLSVLLELTNLVMSSTASSSNKTTSLAKRPTVKAAPTPIAVVEAKRNLTKANRKKKHAKDDKTAKEMFKKAQRDYKKAVRVCRVKAGYKRDKQLFSILTHNPTSLYNFIKSSRNSASTEIQKLTVGDKVYTGDKVQDGFYDSMTSLKSCDIKQLREDSNLSDKFSNYDHIMKLCGGEESIPPITPKKAADLLLRIKKKVKDFYSITAEHYLHAGEEGLSHFSDILNAIAANINNARIKELNIAHGLILYKQHNKDKTSDRSYRTISSCPFLAKAMDLYLRDLYHERWDKCQATTQYQGTGSCHLLASLLITEVIQHSLHVRDKPVFLLFLDAQSAFDRCLRQVLVNELYKAGIDGAAITFIDRRLEHRATVYDWNGVLMGPSRDSTGFEQGGINSSEFYKLYNNQQLETAQMSELGVGMRNTTISATGQADDVVLTANTIDNLALLVRLTESYCARYRVTLVPSKTKLLAFNTPNHEHLIHHAKAINPIKIGGEQVQFVDEGEHVGVVRNTAGNLPTILSRIEAHRKAMRAVLPSGMAQSHRGNPAASLRVHQLYGNSVLFSGLATLVLSQAEVKLVDQHYKQTVQSLQRLHDRTPRSVVLLMAGTLPGEAILHLKQLTLFNMICQLPNDPLHHHGKAVLLSAPPTAKSWFLQIQQLCLKYSLDHPHFLLTHPPPKAVFKREAKKAVTSFWESKLRQEASELDSLHLFLPYNCTLQQPHPLWVTAGSNCFENHKSLVLAKMISGRFKTEYLSRHWTSNKSGYCQLDSCYETVGDLEHLLVTCPGLAVVRDRMWTMVLAKTRILVPLYNLACIINTSPPNIQLQFLTEPLAFTDITDLCNLYGRTVLDIVYYCIRTFVYYIHREKQILLGNWVGDLTVKTRNDKQITKYRQIHRPHKNTVNYVSNPIIHAGNDQSLIDGKYDVMPPASSADTNLQEDSVSLPAAVSALEQGGCWGPGGVGTSAALDCAVEVGVCGGGAGLAGACRSGDLSNDSAVPNTNSRVVSCGRVAQLSPSYCQYSLSQSPV